MNVLERLHLITEMCHLINSTDSRNDKEAIVKKYRDTDEQLSQDITYMFEILSGMHKLGYKFIRCGEYSDHRQELDISLEEYVRPLFQLKDKSEASIYSACQPFSIVYIYLAPILNRQYRIGINKSQVEKTIISPMLAKKYESGKHCNKDGEYYYITEKLDGNRCIAQYDYLVNDKWYFYSRSGKLLNVDFDMAEMPKGLIYDGEILSRQQIENPGQHNFNCLSGAVNSKYGNKDNLVYVIFDIVDDSTTYAKRRFTLNIIDTDRRMKNVLSDTDILPCLDILTKDTMYKLEGLLNDVEEKGGEGLMINLGNRVYEHKRTNGLLKVKSVYTMDMKVIGFNWGEGKYEDAVGALYCEAYDGKITYTCNVGSGLSDEQRFAWANTPELIVGKIVEVAYFSVSQDKNSLGSNIYSLRFPRFKKIRTDKTTTSVD